MDSTSFPVDKVSSLNRKKLKNANEYAALKNLRKELYKEKN